jgi:hypothetical protein
MPQKPPKVTLHPRFSSWAPPSPACGASPNINHPFLLDETQSMPFSPPPSPKTSVAHELEWPTLCQVIMSATPSEVHAGEQVRSPTQSPFLASLSPSLPPIIHATSWAVFLCNCGRTRTTKTTKARRMTAPPVFAIAAAPCHPPSKALALEPAHNKTLSQAVVSPVHRFTRTRAPPVT